ncbi:hypothetical protein [Neomoorella thermoacetica]|nr:hypothetical protein [Moorella thermoacetica]
MIEEVLKQVNYAEALAYWYLRLNGFFLIENFVLHRFDQENKSGSADADLLGIRLPHVYETVGGQKQDWDYERFKSWDIDLSKDYLGVIVEVKSGQNFDKEELLKAFNHKRLVSAIKRCGMFPRSKAAEIANQLKESSSIRQNQWTIMKLAVLGKNIEGPWNVLDIREAEQFVINRIKAYSYIKCRDRLYFPDLLIQYIAWKCGLNV